MPRYRSRKTTQGQIMASAQSLWRATGMSDDDFAKPIIAVVTSNTQFVPGHGHLKDPGEIVATSVWQAGGVPREMNTIAVDDGTAMGHSSFLKSVGLAGPCALITDGRFSDGSSGLSVGHISPKSVEGGTIGLVRDGDPIPIDIARRDLRLNVDERVLYDRRQRRTERCGGPWRPIDRDRRVSSTLRLDGLSAACASEGPVRDLSRLEVR